MNLSKIGLIFISTFVFFGAVFTTYILDFSHRLPNEILISSILDWFLTTAIIFFIFFNYKKTINEFDVFFSCQLRRITERLKWLIYLLSFVAFLYMYTRLDLIVGGATREELNFDESASRFIMLFSPFFVFMSGISIVYKYNFKIKLALLLGVIFISIYNLSRSEIATLIFVVITAFSIKGIHFKVLLKLMLIVVFSIIIVAIMTFLQGRAGTITGSIHGVLNAFFKYKAFSLFLSEFSINEISGDVEQILYPHFGFVIERFLSLFESLSNPISVQNSTFISDFRRLGDSNQYDGNVLYPWWSWFYGVYGLFGVAIKAIQCLLVFYLLRSFKFHFSMFYFIFVMLFTAYFRHPLLNAASVYAILIFLILDFLYYMLINRRLYHANNK
ncbi:O-antigen polymerase [Vibrio paracholerae]|uniref:O-antigen polymerase n=1 Tax=Vibrio paracholerae TaxID=650003 RepID=UPI0020945327|nr:O-antigen polymerase [Vibrio paracholerae]EKO3632751.1 oligosaccharide repeat unit polymerase [Vibrio metschnikovii]EKO3670996.1 oligosaccharide repeat unit polymerase [Vibrio metschnikovii]MCO7030103.1 oligosaccharide repeat unit polymerase [Vibrio paracholerae]